MILSFVALLFSCVRQQEEAVVEPQPLPFTFDEGLLAVDSLMQHDADSALIALFARRNDGNSGNDNTISTGADTCQPVISTEADRRSGDLSEAKAFTKGEKISSKFNSCYHSLLLSEALYKTGNPQLNRFRNETMHYFDSLAAQYPYSDDIVLLSARSHYMNGVGFYENDSVVEACQEYLHTLEIMENHFDVEKLTGYKAKFMGLTYNRLGELFSGQFMIEPAIYCSKKSLFYCQIEPTSKYGVAKNLNRLGMYYDMLGEKDSAYIYYKYALEALPDSNNVIFRDIITHLTIFSYYNLDINSEESIKLLKEIAGQTCNDDEKLSRFLGVGCIYYNEKQYDSAIIYLKNVFANSVNAVSKFQSAEYLYNIYQTLGDTLASSKYSSFLSENAAVQYDNMMMVSKLDKLFNDYLEQQREKLFSHNKKKSPISVAIVCLLITSVIVLILKFLNAKKINKLEIKNREHIEEKQHLLHSIKKSEQQVFELKTELGIKHSETELRRESLLQEPVCKKIHGMVDDLKISARDNYYSHNLSLSDESIRELHIAVLKHCEKFDVILLGKCPQLKQNDLLICYLLIIGLNAKQIAVLKNRTYYAIKKQIEKVEKLLKVEVSLFDYLLTIL